MFHGSYGKPVNGVVSTPGRKDCYTRLVTTRADQPTRWSFAARVVSHEINAVKRRKEHDMEESNLYQTWKIAKRSGGFRTIEAPNDELKAKQRAAMDGLQEALQVSPFAHGFQPYKNIATGAKSHVGKEWVGSIDIEDFFPSIKKEKFCEEMANIGGPAWGPVVESKEIDDAKKAIALGFHDFGDEKGERLPQGAPTSPLLSNAYLFKLDWRMAWLCHERDVDYTRYADDITISGPKRDDIAILLKIAEELMNKHYALKVNRKKTKIIHRSRRQLVCGVVVNSKLNLKREVRKNLRAEVHQKSKLGNLPLETKGRIAFEKMVRECSKESHSSRTICKSIEMTKVLAGA